MGWNKLENNVKGLLATGINAAATAMSVNLLAGSKSYPAGIDVDNPMYLTISSATNPLSNEIVKVTAHTGANVTTMVRGQRGTVAAIWPASAVVSLNLHAEDVEGLQAFVGADGTYTGNVTGNVTGDLSGNVSGNVTGNVTGNLSGNVVLGAGTELLPSLAIAGDLNTGMWSSGADTVGWSTGGTLRLSISTTAITAALPFLATAGSAAAPSISFSGDIDTGVYSPNNNQVAISTNGQGRLFVTTSAVSTSVPCVVDAGYTAAAPNYQTTGSLFTGLYGAVNGSTVGLTVGGLSSVLYGANTIDLMRSAGTLNETRTVHNAAAAHNLLTLRATRGTSATPDYLVAGDVVGSFKFEGRDGAGTWGDVAEISAEATQNHAIGETGGELVLRATVNGSDTMGVAAKAYLWDFGGGGAYAWPTLQAQVFRFYESGVVDLSLGYFGGISARLNGMAVLTSSGNVPLMLGDDGYIYSDNSIVTDDNAWRYGADASAYFSVEQWDSTGEAWEAAYHHDGDTLVLDIPVYNDANVGALVLRTGGTAPGVVQVVDNIGANTGIYAPGFDDNDEGSGSIEIPHDYKEGTDLMFHAHWNAQAAPSGTDYVKFNLIYTVVRDGQTVAPVAIVPNEIPVDTQYKSYRSDFTAITGTNFKIGDQFIFTLARDTADGAAYPGEAIMFTVGFHYQCDTLGSRTIAAK